MICNYNTFANEKPPSPTPFHFMRKRGGGGGGGSDLYINLGLICNYNTFAHEKPPSPTPFHFMSKRGGGGGGELDAGNYTETDCILYRFFIIRSFHSKLSLCFDRMLPLHTAIILRGILFSAVGFPQFWFPKYSLWIVSTVHFTQLFCSLRTVFLPCQIFNTVTRVHCPQFFVSIKTSRSNVWFLCAHPDSGSALKRNRMQHTVYVSIKFRFEKTSFIAKPILYTQL